MRPGRYECREVVEPGGVGISVRGDIHAGIARCIDFGDDFGHASPVVLARNFEMPYLNRDAGFAADAQGFVD